MKKYVKPQLYYERYELTRQVASTKCAVEVNASDVATCTATMDPALTGGVDIFGGLTFFTSEAGCAVTSSMVQSSYCYENGAITVDGLPMSMFNS